MPPITDLIARNRAWSDAQRARDPEYFRRLVTQQAPKYLWIGCADSRVPANEIVGLLPGELFVHRNVANLVVHTDLNCLSVIQYAVWVLRVEHVIVCGHYGCGGIAGALSGERLGLVDNWLRHVQDAAERHRAELDALPTPDARHRRMCELNVIEQVRNVGRTTILQTAWEHDLDVQIHGWIYALEDGLVRPLTPGIRSPRALDAATRFVAG